jgi:hypothetical protein
LMLFLKSSSYSFKAQISFWVSVSILGILYMLKNILPSLCCWIVARVNVTNFLHLLFDGKDAKEHAILQQEWLSPRCRSSWWGCTYVYITKLVTICSSDKSARVGVSVPHIAVSVT